jgi:hypothetical protein
MLPLLSIYVRYDIVEIVQGSKAKNEGGKIQHNAAYLGCFTAGYIQ